MLKHSQHARSKISDTDVMSSKFTLIKNNSVSDYMGQFSQRQEVKGETGGCGVRSNSHPPPSNTVRCFPSSGFLHFRQDDQFSGCLLMWKVTVYVCVSACVLCAFTHACKALFLCLHNCACRQYTRRRSCMCSSASLWTEWPALHVTDLLYQILYEWENRLLISQLL